MAVFRGSAALQWVDAGSPNLSERVLLLREPMRELRAGHRQTVYVADSMDYTQRQTFTIGSGAYELTAQVRWSDNPQSLIDLIKAGAAQQTITYFPNLNDPGTSYACYLISPSDPHVLQMDPQTGTIFGDEMVELVLRKTDGTPFQAVYHNPVLFAFRAGDRITDTFGRSSIANLFTRGALNIAQAAAGIARLSWYDVDGDGIAEVPALLIESGRTNLVLWDRDLTNAAWTKTNVTAAKTQTGIDGTATSASLLTATAGNGTCLQAIVDGSKGRIQTAYVKRVTGAGVVNMTMDNGVTWTAITVTSVWARVSIPFQTLTNPTVGFRIVTNGDAIAVDYVQNESGLFSSTPILTTTVAVTRAADTLNFALPALPQALTLYLRFIEIGTIAITSPRVLTIGIAPPWIFVDTNSAVYYVGYIPTTEVDSFLATAPTTGQVNEFVATLSGAGSVQAFQSIAGGTISSGAASGALALPQSWSSPNLYLNVNGTNFLALTHLYMLRGVQTVATMQKYAGVM